MIYIYFNKCLSYSFLLVLVIHLFYSSEKKIRELFLIFKKIYFIWADP